MNKTAAIRFRGEVKKQATTKKVLGFAFSIHTASNYHIILAKLDVDWGGTTSWCELVAQQNRLIALFLLIGAEQIEFSVGGNFTDSMIDTKQS